MTGETTQMFRARCRACTWDFDVVTLPLPLKEAARVIGNATCPMCANKGGNTCAEPRDLTEAERVHKLALLARAAIPPSRND